MMSFRILRHTLICLALMVCCSITATAERPRMVINLVVSGMHANDLVRYEHNFCNDGFRRLMRSGVVCGDAHYDYALTSTVAGLATLTTGTQPSTHGIVGHRWWNYVDSSLVELITDRKARPVEFSTGSGNYSPHRLVAPTIGDMLLMEDSQSKQFTIAVDATSAIVLNGRRGVAYWAETNQTHWTTSSAYLERVPSWVAEYNRHDTNNFYTLTRWTPLHTAASYCNSEVAVMEDITDKQTKLLTDVNLKLANTLYGRMCYTPAGNTMLLKFARSLIALEHLGQDGSPDMLNICFDASRYIAETYGTESIEYEDMLYRLDRDLAEFLTYVYAQVSNPDHIVITLSSDHGMAPSYNPVGETPRERFNIRQMEVIVNAFLGARYGSEDYILGTANNAIYLNHELILKKRLVLESIREEVAIFMLQLRGIATALSTTAMRNTSFSEGRTRLMQQSYYATRSGDVMFDLMPGWMVEEDGIRSSSLSGYNYDSHIPLIIYGGGIEAQRIDREVNATEFAPTMAHLLQIAAPWASTTKPMKEVTKR